MKQKERKYMKMKAFKHYGTVAALAVIILIFSILRPASFCTVKNFLNISRQAAPLAMVALGATFVMTINEFDLSIGNIVSLDRCFTIYPPDPCGSLFPDRRCDLPFGWLHKRYCSCPFSDSFFYHYSWYGNCIRRCDLWTNRRHNGI